MTNLTKQEKTSEQLQAEKAAARDKVRFLRLTHDGVSCVLECKDFCDFTADMEPGSYTFREVWMTQSEYDALPEFEGY